MEAFSINDEYLYLRLTMFSRKCNLLLNTVYRKESLHS